MTRPRLDDYFDSTGNIALPDGVTLMSNVPEHIAACGDMPAYRYLDYTRDDDGLAVELTWSQLGARLRAVGARLQQVTSPGDRVAILAPQGLDYVVGFFAAIAAGNIAVPLFAPELPGHGERLDAVIADAGPSVVLTTTGAAEAVRGVPEKTSAASATAADRRRRGARRSGLDVHPRSAGHR